MDERENTLLRLVQRLQRLILTHAGNFRSVFAEVRPRTDVEQALRNFISLVISEIPESFVQTESSHVCTRVWTTSFQQPFDLIFEARPGAKNLAHQWRTTLALICPRFCSIELNSLFVEPFEVLFERFPGEYVSTEDISAARLPADMSQKNTLLFPFAFAQTCGDNPDFGPKRELGEFIQLFIQDPHTTYAFKAYAPEFFNRVGLGDYLQWVLRFRDLYSVQTPCYFIVPVLDGFRSLGTFCYAFPNRINEVEKLLLSHLAAETLRTVAMLESLALNARAHTIYSVTNSVLFLAHEITGLLQKQSNSLEKCRIALENGVDEHEVLSSISEAQHYREQILRRVNSTAGDLRTPVVETHHTTIPELANSIHTQIAPEYRDRVLIGYSGTTDTFSIEGDPLVVPEVILPFINNAFQHEVHDPSRKDKEIQAVYQHRKIFGFRLIGGAEDASCLVLMMLYLEASQESRTLHSFVVHVFDVGVGIPADTLQALSKTSFFGRVPSTRIGGGSGILTAIAAIQNKYMGECDFIGGEWIIRIPVGLVSSKDWLEIRAENYGAILNELNRLARHEARALAKKARKLKKLGNYEAAISVCDDVIRRFGTAVDLVVSQQVAAALVRKAGVLEQIGRREEAILAYEEVAQRFGNAVEPPFNDHETHSLEEMPSPSKPGYKKAIVSICTDAMQRLDRAARLAVQQEMAHNLVEKGRRLTDSNRFEESIAVYDQVVRQFGDATEGKIKEEIINALAQKGSALKKLNRLEEAIAAYDELLLRFTDDREYYVREVVAHALMQKGLALDHLNRLPAATEVYNQVVLRFGETTGPELWNVAWALKFKGNVLHKQDLIAEAISAFAEVLKRFGDSSDSVTRWIAAGALNDKAYVLAESGRIEEAIAVCDEVVRRFGDATEVDLLEQVALALVRKAYNLGELSRCEEADAVYSDLEQRFHDRTEPRLRESLAEALNQKAMVLDRSNKREAAIAQYDEVIRRFSDDQDFYICEEVAKALVNKAYNLNALDRSEEAERTYCDLERRFGNSTEPDVCCQLAEGLNDKGIALAQAGRQEEAIRTYDEVIRRFGSSAESGLLRRLATALFNKALVLVDLNRQSEAVVLYEQVMQQFRDTTDLRSQRIVVKALVNYMNICKQLKQTISVVPFFKEIENRLASHTDLEIKDCITNARAIIRDIGGAAEIGAQLN